MLESVVVGGLDLDLPVNALQLSRKTASVTPGISSKVLVANL